MKLGRGVSQGLTPVILVAVAVAMGAWGMRASAVKKAASEREQEQQSVATAEVTVGEVEVVVERVGALEAVRSKPAVAEVSGQVVSVVPDGVRVKEGDEIAVLDVPRMARDLRDQQVEYENALANLETQKLRLAARLRQAEVSVTQAEEELERFRLQKDAELTDAGKQRDYDALNLDLGKERLERKRRLAEEALVPQREVELGTTAIERDKFNLQRQDKELETAITEKDADLLDKQAAVTRAESERARAEGEQEDGIQDATMRLRIQEQQVNRLLDQVERAVIRAPGDGIVVLAEQREGMSARPLQPGDQVWEGRPIATIPDLTEMRVVLEVPQERARFMKRKQPARVLVEAIPGVEFEGEVTEVAQTASEGTFSGTGMPTGEKAFRTFVGIKDLKGVVLRPGMTASVQIVVEKVADAVTVPLESVFDRDGKKVVWLRRGMSFEEVEVSVGQESMDRVVITKGLKGGEEIALRDVSARGKVGSAGNEVSPSASPF